MSEELLQTTPVVTQENEVVLETTPVSIQENEVVSEEVTTEEILPTFDETTGQPA